MSSSDPHGSGGGAGGSQAAGASAASAAPSAASLAAKIEALEPELKELKGKIAAIEEKIAAAQDAAAAYLLRAERQEFKDEAKQLRAMLIGYQHKENLLLESQQRAQQPAAANGETHEHR